MTRVIARLGALLLLVAGTVVVAAPTAPAAPLGTVPTVHVGSTSVAAPTSWSTSARIPLTLQWAAPVPVTVHWQLSGDLTEHAALGHWYGTVTIPAGGLEADIVVPLLPVPLLRVGHHYVVIVTAVDGGTAAPGAGSLDVRPLTTVRPLLDTAARQTVSVPNEGSATVEVPVAAAGPSSRARTFEYQTDSTTAHVGVDYLPTHGTFTLAAGKIMGLVPVTVLGNTLNRTGQIIAVHAHDKARSYWFTGHVWLRPADPLGWSPPPGAVPATGNAIYLQGGGDYVLGGSSHLYTQANSRLTITPSDGGLTASIDGDTWWYVNFSEPSGTRFAPGYLSGVGRYPFTTPGLSLFGDGRACNTSSSDVSVDRVVRDGTGVIQSATMRFAQHCEGTTPAAYGFVRYVKDDPTTPPPPGDPATFPWSPPAGSVPATGNFLYLQSSAGDYIGQGGTYLYTDANGLTASGTSGVTVSIPVSGSTWWTVSMVPPDTESQLTTGLYANVERAPFSNPATGGFEVSGSGRGCNTLVATYAVDAISWKPDGSLGSIAARFVQHCEGASASPLYGALRWTAPG